MRRVPWVVIGVIPLLGLISLAFGQEEVAWGMVAGWLIALIYLALLGRWVRRIGRGVPGGSGRMFIAAFLLFLVDRYLGLGAMIAAAGAFFVTQILYFAGIFSRL